MKIQKFMLIIVLLLVSASCNNDKKQKGVWYKKYVKKVNCGELYNGVIEEHWHSTATVFRPRRYEQKTGNKVDFPSDYCVSIITKEFDKPSLFFKERRQ